MKLFKLSVGTIALSLIFGALCADASPKLHHNDYCAGSPLTMGSSFSGGGKIVDIAVVADADGTPVGWVYASSLGKRLVQANAKMDADAQSALGINARDAVSNLHVRPASLPVGLTVRRCRAEEIARY